MKDISLFNSETISKFAKIIRNKGEGEAYHQACDFVVENFDYGSMDNMCKLMEELITLAKNKL